LAVADTTSLHFGQAHCTQGLGPVGNSATQGSGLLQHSLLAFTPAGLPLGVLESQWWARDPAQFGGNHQRNRKPVSEKESAKWLRSYAALQTHAAQTPTTRWVLVADRESDLYELFAQALAAPQGPGVLVRAQHDRGVEKSTRRLFAHLTGTPVAGQLQVQVARRPGRAARRARVSVRFREVHLSAPPAQGRTTAGDPLGGGSARGASAARVRALALAAADHRAGDHVGRGHADHRLVWRALGH
jgi:hypothetical protein